MYGSAAARKASNANLNARFKMLIFEVMRGNIVTFELNVLSQWRWWL